MQTQNIAVFFLVCVSTFNLVFIYQTLLASIPADENDFDYTAHNFPMALPLPAINLAPVLLTVEDSVHYSLRGPESDHKWSALISDSGGYVRIGPQQRTFVISMFHELHCLRVLNFAYSDSPITDTGHIRHCLDYLRQMAICSAGITLEPGDFAARDFKAERPGPIFVGIGV